MDNMKEKDYRKVTKGGKKAYFEYKNLFPYKASVTSFVAGYNAAKADLKKK